MGTSKSSICNNIVKNICLFCVKNKIWITTAHIPRCSKYHWRLWIRKKLQKCRLDAELWNISKGNKNLKFKPDLDCFVLRLNTQLPKYIFYKPDPYTYLIGAFSVYWWFYKCYLFPLFSLIGRTLQKICMDETEVVLVVPKWPKHFLRNVIPGTICSDPTQRKATSTPEKLHLCGQNGHFWYFQGSSFKSRIWKWHCWHFDDKLEKKHFVQLLSIHDSKFGLNLHLVTRFH